MMRAWIRYICLSIFLVLTTLVTAQSVDVKWFDSKGEPLPSRVGAASYRVAAFDSISGHLFVTDYRLSGEVFRTGSYRSLKPEVRDGKLVWYYAGGHIQKEVVYEDNKLVSYKLLSKDGDPELCALIKLTGKNGEVIWEPRRVDKEPSFVGGKKVLAVYKRDHLEIPPVVFTNFLNAAVLVSCIIGEDGSISNIGLVTSVHPDLDKEAFDTFQTCHVGIRLWLEKHRFRYHICFPSALDRIRGWDL